MADPARRPAIVVGLGAFALGLAFLILDPAGSATRLKESALDLVTTIVPPERMAGGVLVVDIDRGSLAAKGSWPWRRELLADLLSRIEAAGPKAVGIDILLVGRDRRSPAPQLEALARDTGRPDLAALAEGLPDDDRVLAEALGRGRAVLGLVLDAESRDPAPDPPPIAISGKGTALRLPESAGVAPPLPALADAAKAVGVLSLETGPGARVRQVPGFVRGAGEVYAGFAMELLRASEGASAFVLEEDGTVSVGTRRVPLGQDAGFRVHLSPASTWSSRTVSAADVLDGRVTPQTFADRIVLIGTSAPEAGAFIATVADPLTPTVQLQAEALEDLRTGHILQPVPSPAAIELGAAVILGFLALAAALWLGPLAAAAAVILLALGWIGISLFVTATVNRLVNPIGPIIPAFLAANAAALMLFARTRTLRIAIERKFGRYYSPDLVRRLIENPQELKIEGELREVTALFSDIEGFTTMSERAVARTLVSALDAYFEGVCAIVICHGGWVNKVVGDAVYALFNAPLDLPNHAGAALDCAIEIERFTAAFRERPDAKELGFGRTRIGFETGPAIVGDVGGLGRLDYTAHGDAVNSAARLESVNKTFGTTICLGARAAAAIADADRLRPLGRIVLRGRVEPTAVFSPWPQDATTERRRRYLGAFGLVEGDPASALAAFERIGACWPTDPATAYWVRTLRETVASSPDFI